MYKIKIKKMNQSVFNNYFKDKIRLKKYKITKIYLSLKNLKILFRKQLKWT